MIDYNPGSDQEKAEEPSASSVDETSSTGSNSVFLESIRVWCIMLITSHSEPRLYAYV